MDPITVVDPVKALGSIAGIVGMTIALVHIIKRQCGDIPYVNKIPVFVYAWIVSAALTYIAHTVIRVIEGELSILMVSSVLTTILAAGTLEIFRNGNKAIADTRIARQRRAEREQRDLEDPPADQ